MEIGRWVERSIEFLRPRSRAAYLVRHPERERILPAVSNTWVIEQATRTRGGGIIRNAARYGWRGVLFARQIQRGDSTKDPGFPGKSGECSERRQLRRIRARSRPSAPFFMFICSGHAGPDSPTRTTPVINSCRPTRVFN